MFEFHFGKKKRNIYDYVKMGIVLNFGINALSFIPGLSRKDVFNIIDSIQLRTNYDFLNEYIIKDNEFLSYRLERELNKSINQYLRTPNESN